MVVDIRILKHRENLLKVNNGTKEYVKSTTVKSH